MDKNTLKFLILGGLVIAFVTLLTALPAQSRPPLGVTNFDSIHLRDTGPTAQPVLRADQRGTGKIVEFMDAGTAVWSINDGGGVNGKVLAYPTPNTVINCKTNTITDTASYTATVTAISTPQFALCTMNTITGDAEKCAAAVGGGAVTVTVRNSAATPAANAAGAVVYWCAGGTPQ
jgi:hypothetical protein